MHHKRYLFAAGALVFLGACAHGAQQAPVTSAAPAPATAAAPAMAPAVASSHDAEAAQALDEALDAAEQPGDIAENDPDFVTELDDLIEDTPDAEAIADSPQATPSDPQGIPLVYNARVQKLITYFKGRGRERFELWLSRSGAYVPLMQEILVNAGLPSDLVYLALIESGFSPYAYSTAAAVGFWQFIPPTGKRYGLRIDDWIDERRDPVKATHAAARYLKDLYGLFGDWHLAAAGYNAGENKIARAMRKYDSNTFWGLLAGRYLKAETKDYVPKLIAAITIAKDPAAHGFNPQYHEPFTHATVVVAGGLDLRKAAYAAGVTFTTIKRLNPELRRWMTPPAKAVYTLRVPVGAEAGFAERLAMAPEDGDMPFREVTLGKKDTVAKVAALYNVSVADLKLANPKLSTRPGARLLVPVAEDGLRYAERPPKGRATRSVVRVRRGDTLSGLARKYGVSVSALAKHNGIKGSALRAGQRLRIPAR